MQSKNGWVSTNCELILVTVTARVGPKRVGKAVCGTIASR